MHRLLSIRARVVLSLVAMLLPLAALCVTALVTSVKTLDRFEATAAEALHEALPLAHLQTDLLTVQRAARKVVLAEPSAMTDYRTVRSRLRAGFALLGAGDLTEEGALVTSARRSSERAIGVLDDVVSGASSTSASMQARRLAVAGRHIDTALGDLREAERISRIDIGDEYAEASAAQGRAMTIIVVVAAATLGLGLVGATHVVRSVLRPLAALRASVDALERGDLSHRVTGLRNDEFGQLGTSFNAMATALERSHTQLLHHASHDVLTGLANRRLFENRLTDALAEGASTGHRTGLLLLDLDGFKEVNDGLGHHAGDDLLHQVAARLAETVRATDTAARLGGDEFAVLLPGLPDQRAVAELASRVAGVFDEPFMVAGTAARVRASVGVVVQGDAGPGPDELLRRADAAMYSAKRGGGGIRYFDVDRDDVAAGRRLLSELRVAITRGELALDYQPSVRMRDGLVTGAEALVRWDHPEHGRLLPDRFIRLAEQSELIGPLTSWVLEEAVRQCSAWLDERLDLCVAVNLSARSVADHRLPMLVQEALDRHGLPASHLVLELTETSLIQRPDDVGRVLAELVGLGVNLAVDDFGTGYATLAWLKKLPFTALKIDRDFVADLDVGGVGRELVRYTTDLGRSLGKTVVAEGVESVQQWDVLKEMGCEHAQGYHISPPLPADDFRSWLDESEASGTYRVAVLPRVPAGLGPRHAHAPSGA
ncbi:MAG: putative bifunctional diguanylate cyclase/phosphodiesterase [Actinomycetes bacterium]